MTDKPRLYGVVMEAGYVPEALPPQLEPMRAQLAGHRFVSSLASHDGAIAAGVTADALELVLVPCVALCGLLALEAQWTAWLGPEGQAEVSRIAGVPLTAA